MATEKRLIDANAFKMRLEEIRQEYLEEDTYSSNFAAEVIETVQDEYLANAPTVDAVEVVRCAYCDPGSQDYNPCWLCKKGGTAHDVEHCHGTNYGDYEPMQPHCHLCGRKL